MSLAAVVLATAGCGVDGSSEPGAAEDASHDSEWAPEGAAGDGATTGDGSNGDAGEGAAPSDAGASDGGASDATDGTSEAGDATVNDGASEDAAPDVGSSSSDGAASDASRGDSGEDATVDSSVDDAAVAQDAGKSGAEAGSDAGAYADAGTGTDAGGAVEAGTGADAGCTVTYPADWANWRVSDSPNKFTDNGDGTIDDANTGLTWMKTPLSGGSYNANALCQCPWRPPQRIELLSIVDYTRSMPAVDTTYFNIGSQKIWSATLYALYTNRAWDVDFTDGSLVTDSTTYGSANVLCVKGSSSAPASRYTVSTSDAGVPEVLDNGTGLHWQQAIVPGTYSNAGAASQCASPYRLPAVSELLTLIDSSLTTAPAIDLTVFPGTGGTDTYWAETVYLRYSGSAWDVNALGSSGGYPIASVYRARCVR
jgi:hypothetical protein